LKSSPSEEFVILGIQSYAILVDICIELVCAKNFCYFDQLVIVVVTMEKRFFAENLVVDFVKLNHDLLKTGYHTIDANMQP